MVVCGFLPFYNQRNLSCDTAFDSPIGGRKGPKHLLSRRAKFIIWAMTYLGHLFVERSVNTDYSVMPDRTWNLVGISTVHSRLGVSFFQIQYVECLLALQVLNGFQNENGVHTIFVTDYTANPEVAVCQAQWCPPGLNDRVVRFELWDEAAKKGPDFVPGSYWTVRNARMRRANDGYAEGKIVQPKFGRLDADNDFPAMKLLLECVPRSLIRVLVSKIDSPT